MCEVYSNGLARTHCSMCVNTRDERKVHCTCIFFLHRGKDSRIGIRHPDSSRIFRKIKRRSRHRHKCLNMIDEIEGLIDTGDVEEMDNLLHEWLADWEEINSAYISMKVYYDTVNALNHAIQIVNSLRPNPTIVESDSE